MELTWRGYGISLDIRKKQAEEAQGRALKFELRAPSPRQRHEVDKHHVMSSGNRYIAPIR